MDYLTPLEMREAEERAARRGMDTSTLMENAGRAVASIIDDRYGRDGPKRVLVVCGTGNNGGDGLVAARYLRQRSWDVLVLLLGTPFAIKTEEARTNWELVEGSVVSVVNKTQLLDHQRSFDRFGVVVDAIVGTGVHGGLREPAATAVEMINGSTAAKVAVDVPSGLDPLTGEVGGRAVRANITVALHRPKTGLRARAEYTGEIVVADIGVDE